MLKSKVSVAKVGDIIRAQDFPGDPTCYMIGQVIEVQGEVIKCKGIAKVWRSESKGYDNEFTTVQEGYHMLDSRFPGRIAVL